MFRTLLNIFRIPELRNKVLFTLFMLAIYRIGYHVPLPGVNQDHFAELKNPGFLAFKQAETDLATRQQEFEKAEKTLKQRQAELESDKNNPMRMDALSKAQTDVGMAKSALDNATSKRDAAKVKYQQGPGKTDESPAGRLAQYIAMFSGGDLSQSTIFGLGIMPYISSSIIFQLLTTVVPSLEKMQKEGESGRRKIQEWSRYATVPLCIVQAVFWLNYMRSDSGSGSLVHGEFARDLSLWLLQLSVLTAGCIFLMWLGEQMDEYGLGNGISLIIMAGIVSRIPDALRQLIFSSKLSFTGGDSGNITVGTLLFLAFSFVFIIAGSILITQAQRRIPIQQAKHTRGRRIYGGQRQYLPLRVNHGGVMPIIFAQSLMLFPGLLIGMLRPTNATSGFGHFINWLNGQFQIGEYLYMIVELGMIYFFAYFWTTVQFQPKEMANQLRDYGSFIPGLRPGKRTAEYLERVMTRITYVGAAFLCIIAIVPTVISTSMRIPWTVSQFLGGTGLLIVVSVALDLVQRIETNLLMRNYSGFLGGEGGSGKRIKGRQY